MVSPPKKPQSLGFWNNQRRNCFWATPNDLCMTPMRPHRHKGALEKTQHSPAPISSESQPHHGNSCTGWVWPTDELKEFFMFSMKPVLHGRTIWILESRGAPVQIHVSQFSCGRRVLPRPQWQRLLFRLHRQRIRLSVSDNESGREAEQGWDFTVEMQWLPTHGENT